ncbi:aldo/keto reductase [Marine Group I thaumarchaeote]|uniref:Aldo/keto reductase n=1 Tax=Marine Group I thaumarchaeote TaxID=2511932 RepID=A0A7K4NM97_9ARCH|nr:aldo/keto reductase [Marine Group I thaumarchaeote]
MLKRRRLGKTSLQVSEIGLGCWQLGGELNINGVSTTYGNVTKENAKAIVECALDFGVNTFDTADVYSLGQSERRLGEILKERRNDVYIFTKAGNVLTYTETTLSEWDFSDNYLISAINRSLKRLDTDYIDLFQVHIPPESEDDFRNVENAFEKIKSENKANYCGVSIGNQFEKGIELIERGLVDTLQVFFSLLDFNASKKLFSVAKKHNIGLIIAEPLAQGFLTGKYQKQTVFPKNDLRTRFTRDEIKTKVEKANDFQIFVNENRTMNQIALLYVLSHDVVSTCIPGAKSVEQLKSNLTSHERKLYPNELEKIKEIQQKWQKTT